MFTIFNVGSDKEYKCKLGAGAIVELEKKFGKNPINVFLDMEEEVVPSLTPMITILHASLQKYNHGISFEDTEDIYDDYIENGGSIKGLYQFILDLFKSAGYVSVQENTDEEQGN